MADLLSPLEAIMWRVGHDPNLRMTVGAFAILDRPVSHDDLLKRLAYAVDHAPRLRQLPDGYGRARPAWVDEDEGALTHHVRTLTLGPPGSTRQALDLVGLIEAVPFDIERSPWDVTVIEGLEGGRSALYLRAHHVLTDGIGGIRLLALLFDEHDWIHPPPQPVAEPSPAPEPFPELDIEDERPLGTWTFSLTIDVPDAVRRVADGVRAARKVDVLDTGVRGLQRALDVANSVSRQLLVTGGPLSPRSAPPSMQAHYEVLSIDGARSAALGLGGSRNDLLIAAAAAGLGRYYERLGQPCAALRLATPSNPRNARELGGNWFVPTRLEVPTAAGQLVPQFGVVKERLAQARREPALRVASALATSIGRLPNGVLVPALHAQAESVDFAATAVPGLRGVRHICGSQIEACYPLGPRLGCPVNITAFGNADRLDIGLALDPNVFAQPDLLVECMTAVFDDFIDATHLQRRGAAPDA